MVACWDMDAYHVADIWYDDMVYIWGECVNSHIDIPYGIHMDPKWAQWMDDYHIGNIWHHHMV